MRLRAPERREQLMGVATRLFSESGYDATTTAAIAEASGITEPVLYRHFKNKQDLFLAVLRAASQILIGRWRSAVREDVSASEQLREISASVYTGLPEIRDLQRVIYGAASSTDPEVRQVIQIHIDHLVDVAHQIVIHGQRQGEFLASMNSHAMAWSLVNLYTGFSFTRLHFPSEYMDIRVGVDLIVSGLCHGRVNAEQPERQTT